MPGTRGRDLSAAESVFRKGWRMMNEAGVVRLDSRRAFLKVAAAGAVCLLSSRVGTARQTAEYPPTRVITRGPRHHWFGYYDKLQFDPTSRFVLGMEVPFEHRSPTAEDTIRIGMVDLEDDDRWIELGESSAWNWQQGCMLQWLPGSTNTVLWNDREGDRFVCRILNVESGEGRTIPHPIYSVSPDGKSAVTTDFRRIADVRPGYGYAGLPDPLGDQLAPSESGVWRVDLETGEATLIVSLEQIAATGEIPNNQLGGEALFQSPAVQPGWISVYCAAPLAVSQWTPVDPIDYGESRRERRAGRHSERLRVPLHLA